MANSSGEAFLLTTMLYKTANDSSILDPEKKKWEGNAAINLEGMVVK